MFLLDTNVVSELRKVTAGRADPNVAAWNRTVDPETTFIASVVLHELEIGVRLVEQKDAEAGTNLRRWLDKAVRTTFAGRILPLDETAAIAAARLHVPDPRPINDAYIAAVAMTKGLTLVTRNASDFKGMGLTLVNPWNAIGAVKEDKP